MQNKILILVPILICNIVLLYGQITTDSLSVDTLHLQEITVTNTIKRIENQFDRKIITVSETQKTAARSILDILRTLTGVTVDEDGNIRYKGAEATIQVDNQDIKYVFGKIEMIPVERVDKIELVDVALRTGGDGRGGIINITLKAIRNDGLSGMLSTRLNIANFSAINNSREFGNVNYKNEKFTFFANSTLETVNQNTITTTTNDFDLLNLPYFQNITETDHWKRIANYNYFGGFYDPSPTTKFYLSLSYLTQNYIPHTNVAFVETNKNDQSKSTVYRTINKSTENQLFTGAYISYLHKFDTIDTQVKLVASFNIFNIFHNDNNEYNYQILNSINSDSVYNYLNVRNINTKYLHFSAFYNHSISKEMRWNVSYYLMFDWMKPLVFHQFILGKQNLPLEQRTENLNHAHKLSFRWGTEWEKWKFDAGLNLQLEANNGNFVRYTSNMQDTTLFIKKLYVKILPSVILAYKPNKQGEIRLSLAKTAEFPHILQLCNYIDKNSVYNWKSGTSELKSVDFYAACLSYNYDMEKWNASADFFYNYTNNDIKEISIPVNSLISITKPENIAQNSNIGVDVSTWLQMTKKLNFTLSSSIYYLFFDISSLNKMAQKQHLLLLNSIRRQFGYDLKCSMEYSIKNIYTMLYMNYHSKEITYKGYERGYVSSAFNISKKFINNKLRVTLSINNIFSNFVERGSYSDQFGIIRNSTFDGTPYQYNFGISLQYDFNRGDRGTKDLI